MRRSGGGIALVAIVAALAGGALIAQLVSAATQPARPPPAVAEPLFQWSMPSQYGANVSRDGVIVPPSPDQLPRAPWQVSFEVSAAACRAGATYRWSIDGHRIAMRPVPGTRCTFVRSFGAQHPYRVRLAVTGAGAPPPQTQIVTPRNILIVSLGDSVASGESVPDVPDIGQAKWQSISCHRSARSGAAKAAELIEAEDVHSSVTFVPLACSGAKIHAGLLDPYAGIDPPASESPMPPQVERLKDAAARGQVDAVLLSIGANDAHFGDVVVSCALNASRDCFADPLKLKGEPPSAAPASERVAAALARLPADYRELNAAIPPALRSRVHIVEYFDPTRDAQGNTCDGLFGDVDKQEVTAAQEQVLTPLNAAVKRAAADNGWHLVSGVSELFRKHGYCALNDSWVTTFQQSFVRQGGHVEARFKGTLHPNEPGHDATSLLIADSVDRSLGRPVPQRVLITRGPAPDDRLPWLVIALLGALALLLVEGVAWLVVRLIRRA